MNITEPETETIVTNRSPIEHLDAHCMRCPPAYVGLCGTHHESLGPDSVWDRKATPNLCVVCIDLIEYSLVRCANCGRKLS